MLRLFWIAKCAYSQKPVYMNQNQLILFQIFSIFSVNSAPRFGRNNYEIVYHGDFTSSPIGKIEASDVDLSSPVPLNPLADCQIIEYAIVWTSEGDSTFTVNKRTGEVSFKNADSFAEWQVISINTFKMTASNVGSFSNAIDDTRVTVRFSYLPLDPENSEVG